MQTDNQSTSFNWNDAGDEWQSTPNENSISLTQPRVNTAKMTALAAVTAAGGGFLAAHAGCIAAPFIVVATSTGGAALPGIGLAASLGLTTVQLGAWALLRWKKAMKPEKVLTIAGAFTGAAMAAYLHLGDSDHLAKMQNALDWVSQKTAEQQAEFMQNAEYTGQSFMDYIMQICGMPGTTDAEVQSTSTTDTSTIKDPLLKEFVEAMETSRLRRLEETQGQAPGIEP